MSAPPTSSAERELRALLGGGAVVDAGSIAPYTHDMTEGRGVHGTPDAVVLPANAEEVARVVGWCYEHDVPIVPRGGGSGLAGGAVPVFGGVVVGLERMTRVRALDPLQWRMHVEAGLTTAHVHRLARESGLWFPPDPGAAEQSHIGGNAATNAGGPHAFKYGVTGKWVLELEAVVAPGEVVSFGGPVRKDVAGYDLRSLLIGSEGTLGIVTAVWLRLIPAVEAAFPVVAAFADVAAGAQAVESVLASGAVPAAIEYLDGPALRAAGGAVGDERLPENAEFLLIVEADGATEQARRDRDAVVEAVSGGALAVHAPVEDAEVEALWRWRAGVSIAVASHRGAKASEDIAVPVERLAEAIERTREIGARHDLPACSWGHAGDGNLHSTFMLDPRAPAELERAERAAQDLFALAVELGGTVSGEHGIGWVKHDQLARQWSPRAVELHEAVRLAVDPKGLFNPGKKRPRA